MTVPNDGTRNEASTEELNAWVHTRAPMHSAQASITVSPHPSGEHAKVSLDIPEKIHTTLALEPSDLRAIADQLVQAAAAVEEAQGQEQK